MSTFDAAREAARQDNGQFGTQPKAEADVALADVAPLAVDEWVTDEEAGIRVSFTDLDEGYFGEYDEDDANDVALLRIDVQLRGSHPHADLNDDAQGDDENGPWYWAQGDSSLCTNIERDKATPAQLRRLADLAMRDLKDTSTTGWSVSGRVKDLSRLSLNDAQDA